LILRVGSVTLTNNELATHIHGIGLSRSGKSKLIELLCRQLVGQRQGFCLIDPHGTLIRDLLAWLAFMQPQREIYLFEPSNTEKIVGFNPFTFYSDDEAEIATKAEKMLGATLRVWGFTDANSTPRLAKWLKRLYYTLIERQLSIAAIDYFLDYQHAARRNAIIASIQNPSIKSQWQQLYEMKPQAFANYIESTENRLEVFRHPQVRRILGLHQNNLNLRDIINGQKILLVNLQPSTVISDENNRVLGTLLINEIWQIFRERTKPYPYFLIVDECQKYLTPDVSAMLDEARKYGLCLMLWHQREAQLEKDLSSALDNAQTKFIFSTVKDPKEQRFFTFVKSNGEQIEAQVPTVSGYAVSAERVQAYKRELLKDFLTPKEVDTLLKEQQGSNHQAEEVSDDDLFR
jgi:type IV secretory pathway TraG/TraD family ATPase VirD4